MRNFFEHLFTNSFILKFIYSEKAKILRNLHLTFVCIGTVDKSKDDILRNFVAFLEYTNFKQLII